MSDDDVPEEHEPTEGERPELTITETAHAAGVDRRTVRRWLSSGRLPNARRDDEDHRWRIPIADLLGAGIVLNAPAPPEPEPARALDDELRDELARWRERALVAEAKAEERARALDDLRGALRALTAAHDTAPTTPTEPTTSAPDTTRRRWWQPRAR